MVETWKPVAGYEGLYEVSDLGRVRSLDRNVVKTYRGNRRVACLVKGKMRKPSRCTHGYLSLTLPGGRFLVHRLVASAFCDGYAAGLDVNHKNGVRDDNRACNLEWVTRSENHAHSYRELQRKRHAKARPVAVKGDGFLAVFPDQSALAKLLGVVPGSVASAMHNNHKVKGCEVIYV